MSGFQKQVDTQPGVAVPGDYAGTNPRTTLQSGPGEFTAPAAGATVGYFGFVNPATEAMVTPWVAASGYQTGFIHREQQALITAFLGEATMLVPEGYPVTLMNGGDFWLSVLETTGTATPGQRVYARAADGKPTLTASGNAPTQFYVAGPSTYDLTQAGILLKVTSWGGGV